MRKIIPIICFPLALALSCICASAQYRTDIGAGAESGTGNILEDADTSDIPVVITLEQALQIALSENVSVKVADQEIQRTDYARKGTYASLFPQIDVSGSYQRTIKKQVMYMDIPGMDDGLEVGLDNSWSTGFSLSLPIIAPSLWKSLKLSAVQLEQSVESARSSRLSMVDQVKKAYYAILMAQDSYDVLQQSYANARANADTYRHKFEQGTASEYDVLRADVAVRNLEPSLLQAENALRLAKLNLKVLLGIDAELRIGLATRLSDYEEDMYADMLQPDTSLAANTSLRQLDLQSAYLKQALKTQHMSWAPTLAFVGSYTWSSMSNGGMFDDFLVIALVTQLSGQFSCDIVAITAVFSSNGDYHFIDLLYSSASFSALSC